MISWWKADLVLRIDEGTYLGLYRMECNEQIKQMITVGEVSHPLQAWCNIVFMMLVVSSLSLVTLTMTAVFIFNSHYMSEGHD